MALRWGIVSAGRISHDFVVALSTLPKEEHQVVAVGARNGESAKKFAKLHTIPNWYAGYEEIAKNPNIDAVYIGSLNPQHLEQIHLMLDHGKHVLCEKPLCLNLKQVENVIAHANAKKLFLMEALWVRYFPAYQYLKKRIDNGDLGEIKEVRGTMVLPMGPNERLQKKELGGGTIIDMGVYVIQAALFAFRQYPTSIKATGQLNDDGVDLGMEAELTFPNGGKAFLKTGASMDGFEINDYVVVGSKATIILHQIWSPICLTDIDGKFKEFPLPAAKLTTFYWNSVGLRYEAIAVRDAVLAGKLEEDVNASHETSRQLARIEDEIRRQVGVVYPQDSINY